MYTTTPILLLLSLCCLSPSLSQERPDSRRKQAAQRDRERPARVNLAPRTAAEDRRMSGDSLTGGATLPLTRPSRFHDSRESPDGGEIHGIFRAAEDGLSSGVIGRFSSHFASQVALSLRAGESGSYSANQAYYVLEKYLRTRRFSRVELTSLTESGGHPYATGTAAIPPGEGKETAQVYIGLSRTGERWVITQINIY